MGTQGTVRRQPLGHRVGRRAVLRSGVAATAGWVLSGCGGGAGNGENNRNSSAPAPASAPSLQPGGSSSSATALSDSVQPVQFSDVGVSDVGGNRVTVAWSTSEASTAQIEYGLTPSYGSTTAETSARATTHRVVLEGLAPGTTYYFRVRGRTASGGVGVSSGGRFVTAGAAAARSVTLQWDGPSRNADAAQSPLTDLAGYRVYMSSVPGQYSSEAASQVTATESGGTASATITGLAAGTYYFVVSAFDASGNESDLSAELPIALS